MVAKLLNFFYYTTVCYIHDILLLIPSCIYLIPLSHSIDLVREKHCHSRAHLLGDVRYHFLKDWLEISKLFRNLKHRIIIIIVEWLKHEALFLLSYS